MENKTAEEILRDLIEKHLEFKSGLETTSIQYYAEYGKVSGSMYLNVKRLCEEYASQQLAEKDKEIERLRKAIQLCSGSCHFVLSNH